MPKPQLFITNKVMTCELGIKINLNYISTKLRSRGASYNPKKFCAVQYRNVNPKSTILIFQSGKTVIAGATRDIDIRYGIRDLITNLSRLRYKIPDEINAEMQNVVGQASLNYRVDLKKYYKKYKEISQYVPDKFPGVRVKPENMNGVAITIYDTGKMVLTGAKSEEQLQGALDIFSKQIRPFKIRKKKK